MLSASWRSMVRGSQVIGVAVGLLCCATGSLDAGELRRIPFARLDMNDGLSQAAVNTILQDSVGFMWFGTQEGLNRYDGREFKVYLHDPSNPNTLSHDAVLSLHEDRLGQLWIGTDGGGLNRLSERRTAFARFRHDPERPDSLSHDRIRAIHEDSDGTLWIGTDGGGLNRFDAETGTFTAYRHDPTDSQTLSGDRIRDIVDAGEDALYIATYGGGINRFDKRSGRSERFRSKPGDPAGLSDDRVRVLHVDDDGRLLIGTYEGGLDVFDPETGVFSHVRHDPADPTSLAADRVRAILRDGDGGLWVATDGGLSERTSDDSRFNTHRHDRADPTSLSDDRVISLYQDRGGVLWVGTYAGLSKWNATNGAFGLHRSGDEAPGQLSSNVITSLQEDRNGAVWIGTYGGGLNRFDRDTGTFRHYRRSTSRRGGLSDDRVMSLLVDRHDTLWIGTMTAGLNRFDLTSGAIEVFRHDPHDPRSLSSDGITVIFQDSVGDLWAGTYGSGLNRFDRKTGVFERFMHDPGDPTSLSSDRIMALLEDDRGDLWVATEGGGLNHFDRSTQRFTHFRNEPDNPDSLGADHIFSLYEDRGGDLWIGTRGGGLSRWGAADRLARRAVFRRYSRTDGLPSNVVYGILGDDEDRLWIATNRGLCRLDPVTGATKVYTPTDGLQGYDFTFGAQLHTRDGAMFFGGRNGFNSFQPGDILDNGYVPPVALISVSALGDTTTTRVVTDSTLELDYRDHGVAFEFAALDFTAPERNRYRVMLEGFDDDWNDLGARNRISYTNLNPGSYTLRVRAANNDGVWNEQGLRLDLHVASPPWRSWWAYLLYSLTGLLAVLAVAISQRQRLRRLAELDKATALLRVEEQTSRAKTDFLATMSHEIRTPMSGLLGMTGLLLKTSLNSQQRRFAEIANQSGELLLTIINDVLDLSKIEAGKLELGRVSFGVSHVVDATMSMFAEQATVKQIELITDVEPEVPDRLLGDPERLRQILANLIGNAVKFTEQGEIVTRVACVPAGEGTELRFEIADTGIGLSQESQALIFDRFAQDSRGSRASKSGTGLGLAIAKQLTEKMNGEIGVDSQLDRGSVFWFTASFEPAAEEPAEPGPENRLKGCRVLVVDDNVTNLGVLEAMLESWQIRCDGVSSGKEALRALEDASSKATPYDVLVIDLGMPGMDGLELTRRIREQLDCWTPILLMTTVAESLETASLLRLSIVNLLSKPLTHGELSRQLVEVITQEAPTGKTHDDPPTAPDPGTSNEIRVLLAEDSPMNQEVARAMLENIGCAVEIAETGIRAVEAVRRAHYDLILMDCQMPEMDGFEATDEIRRFEGDGDDGQAAGRLPIVAVTAMVMDGDRERCLAAGMDDYLTKPFKQNELEEMVARWTSPDRLD